MINIKQKINFILVFIYLLGLVACQTQLQQNRTNAKITEIAILMPMTGPNATLGRQYNKLIKMGLEDKVKTPIKVISYDGADEHQVLNAIDKIIARNTKIILGPIYSPLTELIKAKAKKHNIIIITMSNNPKLADDKLFVFGHAPLKQLYTIVDYFLDNDYTNFVALLPAGSHSQTITQIIQDMMVQKNATLVRISYYLATPESIDKAVYMISDTVDNLNEMANISKKPVIYISDEPKNLTLLFDSIDKYALATKAIIAGDNRIKLDYLENINITFTGSANILNSDIVARAKTLGIPHISFMHALAYDLGMITAQCINDKFSSENFLNKLNTQELFSGISGKIYFVDSVAKREYNIIKRKEGSDIAVNVQ